MEKSLIMDENDGHIYFIQYIHMLAVSFTTRKEKKERKVPWCCLEINFNPKILYMINLPKL